MLAQRVLVAPLDTDARVDGQSGLAMIVDVLRGRLRLIARKQRKIARASRGVKAP